MGADQLLQSVGYIGIFVSVFIESGIIIGLVLPLPGFTLMFAAGAFAATGRLSLPIVLAVGVSAAISGYFAGYYSGKTYGRRIFHSPRIKQLQPEHITQAEKFYDRHGKVTLVVGRFVPVVHTIAPIVAGLTRMRIGLFFALNIIGGIIWSFSAVFLGYYIGQSIPNIEYYIVVVAVIIAIAINIPVVRRQLEKLSNYIQKM